MLPKDIYTRLKAHLDYVKRMMPSWISPDQRERGLYADYLFNAIAGEQSPLRTPPGLLIRRPGVVRGSGTRDPLDCRALLAPFNGPET